MIVGFSSLFITIRKTYGDVTRNHYIFDFHILIISTFYAIIAKFVKRAVKSVPRIDDETEPQVVLQHFHGSDGSRFIIATITAMKIGFVIGAVVVFAHFDCPCWITIIVVVFQMKQVGLGIFHAFQDLLNNRYG